MSFRSLRARWLSGASSPPPRTRLTVEVLEARELLAVVGQLRIVSYNILNLPNTGAMTTVLQEIGNQSVGGIARPIDVLLLQEVDSSIGGEAALARDILNGLYGPATYSLGTLQQSQASGGDRQAIVYRNSTVNLNGEFEVPGASGPRAPMRYQLAADVAPTYPFYIYNSHYDSADAPDRLDEADAIRTNADALGQGAEVLYVGDFNINDSFEDMYDVELLGAGNGQAFDPISTPGGWGASSSFKSVHTQSTRTTDLGDGGATGGMDDRFDFILHTQEVGALGTTSNGVGLEYRAGSYRAFGNDNTHTFNGAITSGAGIYSATVRTALMNSSDHLPIVVDYDIVVPDGDTTPPTLLSINDGDTDNLVPVNAAQTYTVTFSEDILNGSFTAADLNNAGTAALTIGTPNETSPGVFSVSVTPTSAGTIILRIPAGAVVEDVAGNDLVVPVQDNDTITVDATLPTVAITDNVVGGPITVGTAVTYTLQFSEAVTGIEAGDLGNVGTAAGGFSSFTVVDADTATVQFTPSGPGTMILRISNAGAVIEDTAGNDLAAPATDDTTITVNAPPATFGVSTTTLLDGGVGFLVTFNAPYDISALNLYTGDIGATLDGRDVRVTGPGGNFGVDSSDEFRCNAVPISATQLAFLHTGPNRVAAAGTLPAGSYTLVLDGGSGNSAFRRLSDGAFLDGNGNGTVAADDDYTSPSLAVAAVASDVAVFSAADVVVGPGQTVDVPLVLSNDVNDVRSVALTISSNPAYLEVIGFTVNAAIPGVSSSFTPATGSLTVSSTSVFSTTDAPFLVGNFQVRVPGLGNPGSAPPIGSKSLLDLTVTSVTNAASGAKPFLADDGLHLVAYLGDVFPATGSYTGADVSGLQTLIVGSAAALPLYQNLDPRLIADVNKDGNLTGADVSNLQTRIVGGASSIPPLPGGSGGVSVGGPDPVLFLGSSFTPDGQPANLGNLLVGQTFTLRVSVFVTEPAGVSVARADAVLTYDPNVFQFNGVTAGTIANGSLPNADAFTIQGQEVTPGTVHITGSAPRGPDLAFESTNTLYLVTLTVKPNAAAGTARINLAANNGAFTSVLQDNVSQVLTLIPAPTNDSTDDVDAVYSIRTAPPAVLHLGTVFSADGLPQDLGLAVPGQTVLVPVNVQAPNSSALSVSGADVTLSFDRSVLAFERVTAGALADGSLGGGAFTILAGENTPGNVNITGQANGGVGSQLPAELSGTLYFVHFRVREDAPRLPTDLNLRESDGALTTTVFDNALAPVWLQPGPTNGTRDDADGQLTVRDVVPPVVIPLVGIAEISVSSRGRSRLVTVRFTGLVQLPRNLAAAFKVRGRNARKVRLQVDLSQSTPEQTVAVVSLSGPRTTPRAGGAKLRRSQPSMTILGASILDRFGRPVDADGDGLAGGNRIV